MKVENTEYQYDLNSCGHICYDLPGKFKVNIVGIIGPCAFCLDLGAIIMCRACKIRNDKRTEYSNG